MDSERQSIVKGFPWITLFCGISCGLNIGIATIIVRISRNQHSLRENFYKTSVVQTLLEILWALVFFIFILPGQLDIYAISDEQSYFLQTISQPVRMLLVTGAILTAIERLSVAHVSEMGWKLFRRALFLAFFLVLPTFLVAIIFRNDEWHSRGDCIQCDNMVDCMIEFILEGALLGFSVAVIVSLLLSFIGLSPIKTCSRQEKTHYRIASSITIINYFPLLAETVRSALAFSQHRSLIYTMDNSLFTASIATLTLGCCLRPWLLLIFDPAIRSPIFSSFGNRCCFAKIYSSASSNSSLHSQGGIAADKQSQTNHHPSNSVKTSAISSGRFPRRLIPMKH
ncbi:unnamed protein product, partial [Mesorhabditis belari]|uniref:Uncharacterized protein n=1 Tax=Mesorhabditis belari TaxID=2138241 RepID=A0AAF3ESF6_9BILA